MPKTSIRQAVLHRRRHLDAEICLTRSLQAQDRLLALPEFAGAGCLALYSAVRNEVFTERIFEVAREAGKEVVYPRVAGTGLEFAPALSREELAPGAFGVLEPTQEVPRAPTSIDMLVVPGVAFDGFGHRLGYGKGFYDRALHGVSGRVLLVGLAFELQLVERLPVEVHDLRLDLLVTEERVLDFRTTRPSAGFQPAVHP